MDWPGQTGVLRCDTAVDWLQKHQDIKPANMCLGRAGDLGAQRPMVRIIDHGGSSPDHQLACSDLETLDFTPEPMLAAASNWGAGRIYDNAAEAAAVTTAKADVSAVAFSVLSLMLADGLPKPLTRWGCICLGISPDQIRPAVLQARLQLCQEFVCGTSSFSTVQELISWMQTDRPQLLHLLQCMLHPHPSRRWAPKQLLLHPAIRRLVARRCVELLSGRERWRQGIQAMLQQLASIPQIHLTTASSSSSSSSSGGGDLTSRGSSSNSSSNSLNGWDAEVHDVLAASLDAMAGDHEAVLEHALALDGQNRTLQQQHIDVQQQLHQANRGREADTIQLQAQLRQEGQRAQAAAQARDKAEAKAAVAARQLAVVADQLRQQQQINNDLQQQLIVAEMQWAASPPIAAQPREAAVLGTNISSGQEWQPPQLQPQQQQQQQQQEEEVEEEEEQEERHQQGQAQETLSPCLACQPDPVGTTMVDNHQDITSDGTVSSGSSNSNSTVSSGSSNSNIIGSSSNILSSSSSSSSSRLCGTSLACKAHAAYAVGDDTAGLQPCTPAKQPAVVYSHSSSVTAAPKCPGECSSSNRPSYLLLLSGAVALTTAISAGAALMSRHGTARPVGLAAVWRQALRRCTRR